MANMKPFLIGLTGLSGAGKSTLAKHLEMQGGVKRFRMDCYYKDEDQCPKLPDGRTHWDLPESMHLDQLAEALSELREGHEIFIPIYHRGKSRKIGNILYEPTPVVFVEGLQLFSSEAIRDFFDLKLFLDIPEDIALERRLIRQPHYDVEYHRTVALPAQRKHVLPMRDHADEVIDGSLSIPDVTAVTDQIIHRYLGL